MPIMTLWATQVDVERDFNIRGWILTKQRLNMNDALFEAIMRIYCNSPSMEHDQEQFKEWIIGSVVHWNDAKQRDHNIVLLKKLSLLCKDPESENKSKSELVEKVKRSG